MATTTLTLTDFLLARIAEDAAWVPWNDDSWWQPERYAAECQAKQSLADLHRPSADPPEGFLPYCVGCWEAGGEDGAPSFPCPTIRIVAAVYADHPGYRDEWRP